jgi:hypothetical protein
VKDQNVIVPWAGTGGSAGRNGLFCAPERGKALFGYECYSVARQRVDE